MKRVVFVKHFNNVWDPGRTGELQAAIIVEWRSLETVKEPVSGFWTKWKQLKNQLRGGEEFIVGEGPWEVPGADNV